MNFKNCDCNRILTTEPGWHCLALLDQFSRLKEYIPLEKELENEIKEKLTYDIFYGLAIIPMWGCIVLYTVPGRRWYNFPINDNSFGSYLYQEVFANSERLKTNREYKELIDFL